MENELVVFPDGTFGLAMDLHEFYVGCVVLGSGDSVQAGDLVYETGRVVDVPVGKELLGRVVNPLGQPIDDLGPLDTDTFRPVEFPRPGLLTAPPLTPPSRPGSKPSTRSFPWEKVSGN